jgi:hypothetical protein
MSACVSPFVVVVVMGLASFGAPLVPAAAVVATGAVTNCNGSGPGSLPATVAGATAGETVTFSVPCPPGSPIVLSDTIDLTRNITISGPGPNSMIVSGGFTSGVFAVATGVAADMSGLTVEDGDTYDGGGIHNSGDLTVTDSRVEGNQGGVGAGIANVGGSLTVTTSTLSADYATDVGGGLFNDTGSTATIADSTLAYDSADAGGGLINEGTMAMVDSTVSDDGANTDDGGGILNYGTLTLTASTVSDDTTGELGGGIFNGGWISMTATIVAGNPGGDCSGGIVDAGYNVDDDGSCGLSSPQHSQSDVDPDLGPLENNRGPTDTQVPGLDSPVLDQIPLGTTGNGISLCPGTDQRGVARPQGSECDEGAVELAPAPQAITSPDSATATVGSPFSFTVTTSGLPAPSLIKKGRLPKQLRFTDNGDGSATISGTARRKGVYHLLVTATFGEDPSTNVTQMLTVSVVRG